MKAVPRKSIEERARRTEDFATVYKLVADPWHISRRIPYYRQVWDWIVGRVPSRIERVIDIGCGVGAFLKALQESYPDVYAGGLEFSPIAAQKAQLLTGLHIGVGDIRDDEGFRLCSCVDLITFNDVLYYLGSEWTKGMINCIKFLRPSRVVISRSPKPAEAELTKYERVYSSGECHAALELKELRAFRLPPCPQGEGTQLFGIYDVNYPLR